MTIETRTRVDDATVCVTGAPSEPQDDVGELAVNEEIVEAPRSPFLDSPVSLLRAFQIDESNETFAMADREQTERRHKLAVSRLEEALERHPRKWHTFEELEFSGLLQNQDTSKLQLAIQKRLNSKDVESPSVWTQARKLFEQVFNTLFPLTRNLLLIAKEAQAVC